MQIEIAWYEISGEEPRAMTDFYRARLPVAAAARLICCDTTDTPVIACLKVKKSGCDANVEREPKGGKQEHKAEDDKVMFHGHLPEFLSVL